MLPLNRLRRTKLVALSGIWPKSLPDALLGRSRRPSGTQIPLEQRVDDLEHFAEVSFHLPEFQCGEETRAAKAVNQARPDGHGLDRSEEHTSELQSLMRISYAVFCLKKKKNKVAINI